MAVKIVKTASTENFAITPVKTASGYFSLDIKSHSNPEQQVTISHGEEFDDLMEICFAVRKLNIAVAESKGIAKEKSTKDKKATEEATQEEAASSSEAEATDDEIAPLHTAKPASKTPLVASK